MLSKRLQIAGTIGADAIVNTASGELIALNDSTGRTIKGFRMTGNTEQVTTTGAQLFDISKCPLEHDDVSFKIPKSTGDVVLMGDFEENTQYTLSVQKITSENANSAVLKFDYTDGTRNEITVKDLAKKSLTSDSAKNVKQFVLINPFGGVHEVFGLQIEKGSTATAYEPFTGNKPSPSPEYPQEITHSGKLNADTQKYEVGVKLLGKNLIFGNFEKYSYGKTRCFNDLHSGDYIISLNKKVNIYILNEDGTEITNGWTSTNSFRFSLEKDCRVETRFETEKPEDYDPMIQVASTSSKYEVPKESKTFTLTSDRPLTKWDKLVEQDGQIGWLYKSKIIDGFDGQSSNIAQGGKQGEVHHFSVDFTDVPNGNGNDDIYVDRYRAVAMSYTKAEFGICCNWNSGVKYFSAPNENVTTVQEFKTWLAENPLVLVYETTSTEFIPLPEKEQIAIRNLSTYYPSTTLTNDQGCVMELDYVADTKNFILSQVGAVNAALVNTQTQLL